MTSRLSTLSAGLCLTLVSLVYWEIPIGPTTLQIPAFCILPMAMMMMMRRDGLGIAIRTFSDFAPFWIGNLIYLSIMLFHSVMTPDATGPMYFVSRVWFLFIGLLLAAHLTQLESPTSWYRFLFRSALAGLLVFGLAFAWKARSVGISLPSEIQSLLGGSMARWQRVTMLVFNGTVDGEKLSDDAVVFKNPVSIALVMYSLFALAVFFRTRFWLTRFVSGSTALVGIALVFSLLSKIAIGGMLIGIIVLFSVWFQVAASRVGLATFLLGTLFIAVFALIVASGNAGAVSEKFAGEESYVGRMDQYRQALSQMDDSRYLLFGMGPQHAFDGKRLHNLLIGSWVEGGLVAFLGAVIQLVYPFYLMIRWFPQHIRMSSQTRILMGVGWSLVTLVSLRSMVAGAGGYHDLISMVAICVALGIFSHARDWSQEDTVDWDHESERDDSDNEIDDDEQEEGSADNPSSQDGRHSIVTTPIEA